MQYSFFKAPILESVIALVPETQQANDVAVGAWVSSRLKATMPRTIDYVPWKFSNVNPLPARGIMLRVAPEVHEAIRSRAKRDRVTIPQLINSLVSRDKDTVLKLTAEERAADLAVKKARERQKAAAARKADRARPLCIDEEDVPHLSLD